MPFDVALCLLKEQIFVLYWDGPATVCTCLCLMFVWCHMDMWRQLLLEPRYFIVWLILSLYLLYIYIPYYAVLGEAVFIHVIMGYLEHLRLLMVYFYFFPYTAHIEILVKLTLSTSIKSHWCWMQNQPSPCPYSIPVMSFNRDSSCSPDTPPLQTT